MANLVLTAIGDDRPGLVDALASAVAEHGGSWERAEMARLGGKFAGIVQVVVPDERVEELGRALVDLADQGLLEVSVDDAGPEVAVEGARVGINLIGADQPGLLRAVSGVLASLGVNIEDLTTAVVDAPMAGGVVFEASGVAVLPEAVAVEELRARLEELATHLMVDIDVATEQ